MRFNLKRFFIISLCLFGILSQSLWITEGEAVAKPKKKGTAKTLPKEWEPYAPKLKLLLQKSQNKSLFTPEDSDTLDELRQVSDDLQDRYAKVKDVAPILYQLGLLFSYREQWASAYDAFITITERFPESPYAPKARFQMGRLKKRLGEDYLVLEESRVPPADLPMPTLPSKGTVAPNK
jgi:TolA-binding protein